MQIHAQTKIVIRENPVDRPIIFIVDFLRLDRSTFSLIHIQNSDFKRVHLSKKESEINIITKFLVVFNEELLSSKKEKSKLSNVNFTDVESIKIERERSFEMYGKKGKNGVLIIKTKPCN